MNTVLCNYVDGNPRDEISKTGFKFNGLIYVPRLLVIVYISAGTYDVQETLFKLNRCVVAIRAQGRAVHCIESIRNPAPHIHHRAKIRLELFGLGVIRCL